MQYPGGGTVHLGDKVRLWEGAEGVVVCSLDTAEYSKEYPQSAWGYLERGILVLSLQIGLIHLSEPVCDLEFLPVPPEGDVPPA
jgi:hypothetical protein